MKKRVVLIGTGGRANGYTMYGAKEQIDLVGVADPNAGNRRMFLGLNSLVGLVPEYEDWREMLDRSGPLDGMIITTPNHLHVEPAVEGMKRGLVVVLEKPIAECPDSCRRLLEAKRRYRARLMIGFNMRSSLFYCKARQWIDDGRIGEVVSIQADELPHVLTTSVMFRSDWRRWKKTSGGSFLEKCCHDMDMLTWMTGGRPMRLNSFGGVKSLAPNPNLPQRCEDCAIQAQCAYYLPPAKYEHPDMVHKANDGLLYKFTRDNSACIYNNGHDIYDHQNVQIEYDNGVIATLTVDFAVVGKPAGRTLKIVGTKGVIWGKVEDLTLFVQDRLTDAVEEFKIKDDGSGHGGSNRIHADAFVRMMEDPDFQSAASMEAGYLSAMLCFAADQSVEEKRQIDVSGIMTEAGLKPGFQVE
jgi:predicted dehydrogenase